MTPFAGLSDFALYRITNARRSFRAPYPWGICLRISGSAEAESGVFGGSGLKVIAFHSEKSRACWLTAMRLAKVIEPSRPSIRSFRSVPSIPSFAFSPSRPIRSSSRPRRASRESKPAPDREQTELRDLDRAVAVAVGPGYRDRIAGSPGYVARWKLNETRLIERSRFVAVWQTTQGKLQSVQEQTVRTERQSKGSIRQLQRVKRESRIPLPRFLSIALLSPVFVALTAFVGREKKRSVRSESRVGSRAGGRWCAKGVVEGRGAVSGGSFENGGKKKR